MTFKCSYCGHEGKAVLDSPAPYVVVCKGCRRRLALISKDKKLPLLPFENDETLFGYIKDWKTE